MAGAGQGAARGDRLEDLLGLLSLEQLDDDVFRGYAPAMEAERIFGGQVAAQTLMAAGRTVAPGRGVATLQATFLRQGDPEQPLLFEVSRVGDGRSFSFRRVVTRQGSRPIFALAATFHTGDVGPEHAVAGVALEPTSVPDFEPDEAPMIIGSFELRHDRPHADGATTLAFRTTGPLRDDDLLHTCIATYASDLYILDAPLSVHGLTGVDPRLYVASIDHALWFHHQPRVDEWLIYRTTTPVAAHGRTLVRGEMHTADGLLVASVTQMGLMRYTDAAVRP